MGTTVLEATAVALAATVFVAISVATANCVGAALLISVDCVTFAVEQPLKISENIRIQGISFCLFTGNTSPLHQFNKPPLQHKVH